MSEPTDNEVLAAAILQAAASGDTEAVERLRALDPDDIAHATGEADDESDEAYAEAGGILADCLTHLAQHMGWEPPPDADEIAERLRKQN